jgi:hypothetical protein
VNFFVAIAWKIRTTLRAPFAARTQRKTLRQSRQTYFGENFPEARFIV